MKTAAWIVASLLAPPPAAAPVPDGWASAGDARISFGEAGKPVYRLDCTGSELVVSQFGVTRLLDMQSNRPVGDTEGTALPAGAALMALATDRTKAPDLVPAEAVRNPDKGWDMTIRLARNHPALLSLSRAKYVSLFTTGFTRAVGIGKADRKLLADFAGRCRGEIPG